MTRANNKVTLNSKQGIYVGLDVHKSKWSVSIRHCDEEIGHFTIPGSYEALEKLLIRYEGMEIHSVYEAGFSGFWLHKKLVKAGVRNIIVSPNKIPVQAGDLVKTDRRDSKKLAFSLSKGLLTANHIPTTGEINARQLIRAREQFKRKRTRVINQLKMLLLQYDMKLTKGITKATREMLTKLELPENISLTVKLLLEELNFHEGKILELSKQAHKECQKEPYQEVYKILQTIPGIGQVVSAALCFEIGKWDRFDNPNQLCAYLGLTPREYSSGENVYRGRITGQGNPWLRSYLVESAWKTIIGDPAIREFYFRVKMNSGSGKKAIVAVARKMVHRMYSIVKANQCYKTGMGVAA